MVEFLEESTNEVRSIQKFSRLIQLMAYVVVWAISIIVFWVSGRVDAMGYSLVVFYMVLPITTLIISIFIGKDDGGANYKWLMLIFFGFMYMLAPYATFNLANKVAFGKLNAPEIAGMLPGISLQQECL